MTLSFFSSNLPATAVAFAAAVTAAFASLRYYSDKAAKVTDLPSVQKRQMDSVLATIKIRAHLAHR
jgi:hypothetical protein